MSKSKLKVLSIVGTRPEIIRLAAVIKLLEAHVDHKMVHTGQNYDYELNQIFFEDLGLRKPDYYLNVDTSSLGHVLGETLIRVEEVSLQEQPDAVLILGDTNAAIAGWAGAHAISRRKTVVLSDEDLFPPGTVKINGIKLYGEEMRHAVTYAASIMKDSGSGLRRLFDNLLRSENGRYLKVEEFSFYEEGGFSAEYHGESLLLGTAAFMRRMDVRLPGNLNLKTGMFLAVDRQLVAVFAIKYQETENVEWALKMLKRNAIVPVLAARDPNITPQLLKRKFRLS